MKPLSRARQELGGMGLCVLRAMFLACCNSNSAFQMAHPNNYPKAGLYQFLRGNIIYIYYIMYIYIYVNLYYFFINYIYILYYVCICIYNYTYIHNEGYTVISQLVTPLSLGP